jgi:hypothetical protein
MRAIVKDGNKMGTVRLIPDARRAGMICFNVIRFFLILGALLLSCAMPLRADDTNLEEQVQLLREQNAILQQQLQKQGDVLDSLTKKIQDMEAASAGKDNSGSDNSAPTKGGFNLAR